MKKLNTLLFTIFAATLVVTTSGVVHSQALPLQQEELYGVIDRMIKYTMDVAQALPEEKFNYKPVEPVRSFGENLIHLTDSNFGTASFVFGASPSEERIKASSKTQIISELQRSFDFVKKQIKNTSNEQLVRIVEHTTRMGWVLYWLDHLTHTRGQLTTYLRANGIVPPTYSSWRIRK